MARLHFLFKTSSQSPNKPIRQRLTCLPINFLTCLGFPSPSLRHPSFCLAYQSIVYKLEMNIEENPSGCYLHPNEAMVGICAICLRERLVILASKQGLQPREAPLFTSLQRKPALPIPKVFALSTFLHLLEPRHAAKCDVSHYDDDVSSIASLEDSFISMKFEGNGKVSWNSNKVGISAKGVERSMIENSTATIRWRKRIGQLVELTRWRKSCKANSCNVGVGRKMESMKVKGGWIRSLTKKRTTTTC